MKATSLRAAALVIATATLAAAQTAAPPDRFFDSNGVQIRYVEQGAGDPVIMLHGYTGTRILVERALTSAGQSRIRS